MRLSGISPFPIKELKNGRKYRLKLPVFEKTLKANPKKFAGIVFQIYICRS